MTAKLLIILLLSLSLSACFPGFGSGGSNKGKEGAFEKGKATQGFPSLPLYPKAKIIESYGRGGAFGLSAISDEKISKVVEFYDKSLGPLGWEFKTRQNNDSNYSFDIKNSKQQGVVIVNTAADGKKTAITISVSLR